MNTQTKLPFLTNEYINKNANTIKRMSVLYDSIIINNTNYKLSDSEFAHKQIRNFIDDLKYVTLGFTRIRWDSYEDKCVAAYMARIYDDIIDNIIDRILCKVSVEMMHNNSILITGVRLIDESINTMIMDRRVEYDLTKTNDFNNLKSIILNEFIDYYGTKEYDENSLLSFAYVVCNWIRTLESDIIKLVVKYNDILMSKKQLITREILELYNV